VLTLVKVKLPPPTVAARVNITFLQHALFLWPCLGADLPSARPFNNKCLPTLFVTDNVVVVVGGGGEIKLTLWKHLKGHAVEIRVIATGETHKRFYNYYHYYYYNNNNCNNIIFYNNRAWASIGFSPMKYNIICYDFTYEYEHHVLYAFFKFLTIDVCYRQWYIFRDRIVPASIS